jgi:hypothetical protein
VAGVAGDNIGGIISIDVVEKGAEPGIIGYNLGACGAALKEVAPSIEEEAGGILVTGLVVAAGIGAFGEEYIGNGIGVIAIGGGDLGFVHAGCGANHGCECSQYNKYNEPAHLFIDNLILKLGIKVVSHKS